jgi:hypothetical protein
MAVACGGGKQVLRLRRLVEAVAAQSQQLEEVGQSARIAHHLVDGDRQRLELGQVRMRRVRQLELSLSRQHQRGGDRELLADRGNAKARRRRYGYTELDAGETIALAELDRAATHDADHGAGRVRLGIGSEQRVDAMFEGKRRNRSRHNDE